MENPYAPPQAKQEPRPRILDLFERAAKYQHRVFFAGLLVLIGSVVIPMDDGSIGQTILEYTAAAGLIIVVSALLFALPLAVWGLVKGFREGRRR